MITLIDPPALTVTLPDGVELTALGLGRHALQEWMDRSKERPIVAALGEVITGWSNVADADGMPVPYSTTALARYFDADATRLDAVFTGYLDALAKAREKN